MCTFRRYRDAKAATRSFFAKAGIAVKVENTETELLSAVERLSEPGNAEEMRKRQRAVINQNAAMDICELLETVAQ